jgi:hypothetical protein
MQIKEANYVNVSRTKQKVAKTVPIYLSHLHYNYDKTVFF